jgi:hypothetical protein
VSASNQTTVVFALSTALSLLAQLHWQIKKNAPDFQAGGKEEAAMKRREGRGFTFHMAKETLNKSQIV